MFTAKITSKAKFKGRITLVVQYTNGTETFDEEISVAAAVPMEWINAQVRNRIKSLQAAYDFADTIVVNQDVDLTEPPAPTAAEIAKEEFIQTYQKWLRVKRAIDAEVLTGNETQVVALRNKVQADFRPAYLDVI